MAEETIKAHCNKCVGVRNHNVLFSEKEHTEQNVDDDRDGIIIWWEDKYALVKCRGCGNLSLMHTSCFSEDCDYNGNPYEKINYYPPAISKPIPKWINELDTFLNSEETQIAELLKEIYAALYNDSKRLAILGIRSLLEHIMIAKTGDKGTFTKNIDSFCESGHIASKQKDLLIKALEVGHATTHRSFAPRIDDIMTTVEICETIIEMIYIHPKKMERVSKRIPKRSK
ncbi:MAG: DUF4145 domain-containing protein [bacterium]|nr:DUF4145 domain-containing protein [bacterium]